MNSNEYLSLRHGAGFTGRTDRGWIVVTGEDRAQYLQGLLTNDVMALGDGAGCYAAYLTPQGRMIADLHVLNIGDRILLDVDGSVRAKLVSRFEALVFTEDVRVTDLTESWMSYGVHGPGAPSVVGVAVARNELRDLTLYQSQRVPFLDTTVLVTRTDELGVIGYALFVDRHAGLALRERLIAARVVEVTETALEVVRVEAGRPAFPIDIDEQTIPLEVGIEDRAISFEKGCYVGQEVIVRILHRGQGRVAQKLVGLKLGQAGTPAAVPQRDALVWRADGKVGRVTSAVLSPSLRTPIALAYVVRELAETGTRVEVTAGNGRAGAVVSALPFVDCE